MTRTRTKQRHKQERNKTQTRKQITKQGQKKPKRNKTQTRTKQDANKNANNRTNTKHKPGQITKKKILLYICSNGQNNVNVPRATYDEETVYQKEIWTKIQVWDYNGVGETNKTKGV